MAPKLCFFFAVKTLNSHYRNIITLSRNFWQFFKIPDDLSISYSHFTVWKNEKCSLKYHFHEILVTIVISMGQCGNCCVTVWNYGKFSLTEKKFRQITNLVISLVKPMLSRNFGEKSVRENFFNFHTVCVLVSYFWQRFRESNVFTIAI